MSIYTVQYSSLCSELIVRYQVRARECEQYKGRLAGLEQANTGLRAELQVLHKVGNYQ